MLKRLLLWSHPLAVYLMLGGFALMVLVWLGAEDEALEKYGLRAFILGFMITFLAQFIPAPGVRTPASKEGLPVEPSGVFIGPDEMLEVGTRVLAPQMNMWWRAQILQVRSPGRVLIHYLGWDSVWDEVVEQSRLQVDPNATRQSPS